MECQLKISMHCKKIISGKHINYIDCKACCENCYWLRKQQLKTERTKVRNKIKINEIGKAELPKSEAYKLLDTAKKRWWEK